MKELREDTLGQRIKAQRLRIGMTQEELAEKMNTTKSMISYYENDHGDMKMSLISEFAHILNTSIEYLVCNPIRKQIIDNDVREFISLYENLDNKTKEIVLIQIRALQN